MIFRKEDLLQDDYSWDEPIDEKIASDNHPTRLRFDRFNGFAILRIINLINTLVSPLTLVEVRYLEEILLNELPLLPKSEVSVFNWLKHKHTLHFTKPVTKK